MTAEERERVVERLAKLVDRKAKTKRRVELLIADCEWLMGNPAGERIVATLEELFCVQPSPKVLMRKTGEEGKALIARWQGAYDVVRFLRAAARGALKIHEAA